MSTPPTNQLSYMARKAICGSLESGDYITALESAQSILSWDACQANPEFLAQVVDLCRKIDVVTNKNDYNCRRHSKN